MYFLRLPPRRAPPCRLDSASVPPAGLAQVSKLTGTDTRNREPHHVAAGATRRGTGRCERRIPVSHGHGLAIRLFPTLDGRTALAFHSRMGLSNATVNTSGAPDVVASYRAAYRREHISRGYSGPLHLGFTVFACTVVIAWCIAGIDNVRPWEWLTVPLTFLYANLVEYFGHRGPMHHPRPGLRVIFERHARQHHRFFRDDAMAFDNPRDFKAVLFPPVLIVFYVVGFALPIGLLIAWLVSRNVALLFVATAVTYFLNYEVLHFSYHAPADAWIARLPLMDRLRRLHTLHHRPELMQRYNFNITYPIGDRLFGTLYRG